MAGAGPIADTRTCSFSFDLREREENVRSGRVDVWECPHEASVGDQCLFHAPPAEKDDAAVVRALVRALDDHDGTDRERRHKQFVGARFGDLNLEFATVDSADNYPLDLRYCHVEGALDCSHAVFTEPVDLRGITVEGPASFVDARFYHDVWLADSTFEDDVDLYDVQFDDDAHVSGVRFGGEVELEDASFREELDLTGASFDGPVDALDATFVDEADLSGARFTAATSFAEASFDDECLLVDCRVDGTFSFAEATFEGDLVVRGLSGSGQLLDLRRADIRGGELVRQRGDRVFDLTGATLGDVEFEVDGGRTFDGFHVEETSFDGFDFGRYVGDLANAEWNIHGSAGGVAGTDDGDDPATVENTYVNAKNGAKACGNDRVAAEFFRQEMRFRALGHRRRVFDGDLPLARRLNAAGALVANAALGITTGHGERPSRVVAFSVALVFGFALVFALVMDGQPYGRTVGYLVLSATSFVTLVLGGGETIEDPWVRLLAEVEGFTGAFLIALFVFTLTRSINR